MDLNAPLGMTPPPRRRRPVVLLAGGVFVAAATAAVALALVGAAFVLNGLVRLPLLETLAILAPLSLIWAWPRKSKQPTA